MNQNKPNILPSHSQNHKRTPFYYPPPPAPPALPPSSPSNSLLPHTLWNHVTLHLFMLYLLGSLPALPQPIEAIAGVQPVVGVVVLTHSAPDMATSHSALVLLYIASLLCAPFFSVTPPPQWVRSDLSPLWYSTLWLRGALSQAEGVCESGEWGEWSERGRREEAVKGGEMREEGAQWCCYGSSCHHCLSGDLAGGTKIVATCTCMRTDTHIQTLVKCVKAQPLVFWLVF